MTKHRKTVAGVAIAGVLAVVVLAAPSGAQTDDQPITTRVKLLEHKVKTLEATVGALAGPEAALCVRGPLHQALGVHRAEGRSSDGATRQAGMHKTYLLDCGPHGVARHHESAVGSGSWCYDLDGMTKGSTAAVPAVWASWWESVKAAGVDDICTTSGNDAKEINSGGTRRHAADHALVLHHTDIALGWERWHTDQHPALPAPPS